MVLNELFTLTNLIKLQALIFKLVKVVIIDKNKNLIFVAF